MEETDRSEVRVIMKTLSERRELTSNGPKNFQITSKLLPGTDTDKRTRGDIISLIPKEEHCFHIYYKTYRGLSV
jgi:hypothetical protein